MKPACDLSSNLLLTRDMLFISHALFSPLSVVPKRLVEIRHSRGEKALMSAGLSDGWNWVRREEEMKRS